MSISFVSIHVRRTDYVKWIENRYHGHVVDHVFFNHCMNALQTSEAEAVSIGKQSNQRLVRQNTERR